MHLLVIFHKVYIYLLTWPTHLLALTRKFSQSIYIYTYLLTLPTHLLALTRNFSQSIYLLITYLPCLQVKRRGGQLELGEEVESEILTALKAMERNGLGPTMQEFREDVREILINNNIETRFKDSRPGQDWLNNFMKRHNLTLKKGGQMQIARKNVTSDPFAIYDYYDKLDQMMTDLDIKDKPQCIWNLDETSFPMDPSKRKTIGSKGTKAMQVTSGAGRMNITVLATCCADGTAKAPLIIYKGQRVQSSWIGTDPLLGTQYSASENGWMTTKIFENFFEKFVAEVRVDNDLPLLMILDGHSSHKSKKTLRIAKENNIHFLRLPSHTTDLLQPLDVSCFAPIKMRYETKLLDHVHATAAREPLKRSQFADLLCSVWHEGLSPDNIKSGFRATGIYPLDRSVYDLSRLDPIKVKSYEEWNAAGRPVDQDGKPLVESTYKHTEQESIITATGHPTTASMTTMSSNIRLLKTKSSSLNTLRAYPSTSSTSSSIPSSGSSFFETGGKCNHSIQATIANLQRLAPKGMKYQISMVPKDDPLAMDAVLLGRGRRPQFSGPTRRSTISNYAEVLTSDEAIARIEEKEKQEAVAQQKKEQRQKDIAEKKRKREEQKQQKEQKKKGKKAKLSSDELSTSISDDHMSLNDSSDLSLQDLLQNDEETGDELDQSSRKSKCAGKEHLIKKTIKQVKSKDNEESKRAEVKVNAEMNTGEELKNPTITEESIGKYYATLYTSPKTTYYWGKVLKTFENDVDSEVESVEMDFLSKKDLGSNPESWTWNQKGRPDIEIVEAKYIFYGPALPDINKGKFSFPDKQVYEYLLELQNTY